MNQCDGCMARKPSYETDNGSIIHIMNNGAGRYMDLMACTADRYPTTLPCLMSEELDQELGA